MDRDHNGFIDILSEVMGGKGILSMSKADRVAASDRIRAVQQLIDDGILTSANIGFPGDFGGSPNYIAEGSVAAAGAIILITRDAAYVLTNVSPTVGELRAADIKDAHHIIQDAAVRNIRGYDTNKAPGVPLQGPPNSKGSPHYIATQIQRQSGGGTYQNEMRIGYKALRKAGLSAEEARAAIVRANRHFQKLGVTGSTPTRIPGNRP